MHCEELIGRITDYLEDTLDNAGRRRFEAHAARCPSCATHVEQMRVTISIANQLEEEAIATDVLETLQRAFLGWKAQRK